MADSRDMFVVHDMFRREFNAIPGLVSEVPGEDGAQVTIVADHVVWMVTFLHAHHHGEDLFVWPKLLERVPVKIDPLIFTMKAQHKGLAQALDDLGVKAAGWRKTSAAAERDAVAGAATDLLGLIAEHLDLEEHEVLPLIDTYLTETEWKKVCGSGLKEMSFGQLKVAFDMILNDAGPEQVKIMRDTIPRVPWMIFPSPGPGPTPGTPNASTARTFPRTQGQPEKASHDDPDRLTPNRLHFSCLFLLP
jgi:hemerythrin-like domain-containing protein